MPGVSINAAVTSLVERSLMSSAISTTLLCVVTLAAIVVLPAS